jgi:hypothetical protein
LRELKVLQPDEDLAWRERYVEEEIEPEVDKGPGDRGKKECKHPPFALTDLELYEGAERRADDEPKKPD